MRRSSKDNHPAIRTVSYHLVQIFALAVFFSACRSAALYVDPDEPSRATEPAPDSSNLVYRVFLIGNAGKAQPGEPALRLLKAELQRTGENGAVVFLGNNIPGGGLPDSASALRMDIERPLIEQLDAVRGFPGRIVFIPGNRDRSRREAETPELLGREERFVESTLGRGNTFYPDDGFPGPVAVRLTPDIVLIVMDTQWWLDREKRTGDTGTYDLENPADFVNELSDLLYKYRDENVIVAGHHPLFSNGRYGGQFSFWDHMTPLPLIGSIQPFYRKFIGFPQDLASSRYRVFRQEMLRTFATQESLIYVSAHDRSLQYFRKPGRGSLHHFIVSGAGSERSYVAGGLGATFTAREEGYITLQYYRDRSVWMEAWAARGDGSGRLLFRRQLKVPAPAAPEERSAPAATASVDYRDSTRIQAVNPNYTRVHGLGAILFGRNNRKLWATPITVPALDLEHTAGGLTPIRRGGNSQSITLWLQGRNDRTYIVRTVDKVAGRAWPPEMRATFARQMVQDQVSMLNPFGALLAAPLAEAAGVYHTDPKLVYIPDDPRLGEFGKDLVGKVAYLEIRPDEDMSDMPEVGNAENVVGTARLFQEINGDNDHRVDARAFARARLLDMLMADHDRTTDNFRWAAFEPFQVDSTLTGEAREEGKIYRPVPRDRDMAFLKIDGLVPTLYQRLVEATWQDFGYHYGFIRGLNKKGLSLDRRFTASLTRTDWITLADSIRAVLTDDVIERAVRAALPEPVFRTAGAGFIERLRVRRDKLPRVAEKYSAVLARVVDVIGSDKHERFEVFRRINAETEVIVYKTSKEGTIRKPIFRRTVLSKETREVRLFGFDGNDRFIVRGSVSGGPLLTIVGGDGDDVLVDSSRVGGFGRRTRYYDTPAGTEVTSGGETQLHLKDDPGINRYERTGFKYDLVHPLASLGSNADEGLIVGAGFRATRHGFRKEPFARQHDVMARIATGTAALDLKYAGRFTGIAGPWSMEVNAGFANPNSIYNFYGLGNETTDDLGDAEYYQARLTRAYTQASFVHTLTPGATLRFGPVFRYWDVQEDPDRLLNELQEGLARRTFNELVYGGFDATFDLEALDHKPNPRQGFRSTTAANVQMDVGAPSHRYATVHSDVSLFVSPSLSPQVTFGARIGGDHIIGKFPFYAANTLGGSRNLRGYRSTRFAGRSSLYGNFDMRLQLHQFSNELGYGEWGILGFFDTGRVWTDGERSDVWHKGYGGGLWIHLFDSFTFTGSIGFSNEDRVLTTGMGFFF